MKGAIGIRLFGDGLSVFDMAVTTIVLLLFAIYLIKYFSESKKNRGRKGKGGKNY